MTAPVLSEKVWWLSTVISRWLIPELRIVEMSLIRHRIGDDRLLKIEAISPQ
jgi:hypothetical protein